MALFPPDDRPEYHKVFDPDSGEFSSRGPAPVLQLSKVQSANKAEALKIIEELKQAIESGEAVCFAGVTLNRGDEVRAWTATTEPVSRLRTMGAVSHLLACLHSGDA